MMGDNKQSLLNAYRLSCIIKKVCSCVCAKCGYVHNGRKNVNCISILWFWHWLCTSKVCHLPGFLFLRIPWRILGNRRVARAANVLHSPEQLQPRHINLGDGAVHHFPSITLVVLFVVSFFVHPEFGVQRCVPILESVLASVSWDVA